MAASLFLISFSVIFLFLAVIKMEGGTENDLRILEQEEEEERQEKVEAAKKEEPRPPDADRKAPEREEKEEGKKVWGDATPWGLSWGLLGPMGSLLRSPWFL